MFRKYRQKSDIYPYMHPILVKIIKEKTDAWLSEYQSNNQIKK